jgi:hypothetical protein
MIYPTLAMLFAALTCSAIPSEKLILFFHPRRFWAAELSPLEISREIVGRAFQPQTNVFFFYLR